MCWAEKAYLRKVDGWERIPIAEIVANITSRAEEGLETTFNDLLQRGLSSSLQLRAALGWCVENGHLVVSS